MNSELLTLITINETLEENQDFKNNPTCGETLGMTLDFYKRTGFKPPWVCYYVKQNNILVGSCGFKGQPVNGTVEIAYGTFEKFRKQGIGSEICKSLVNLSLSTDSSVRITARTIREKNYSTRILEKNGFKLLGTVLDPEDGEVWEWDL